MKSSSSRAEKLCSAGRSYSGEGRLCCSWSISCWLLVDAAHRMARCGLYALGVLTDGVPPRVGHHLASPAQHFTRCCRRRRTVEGTEAHQEWSDVRGCRCAAGDTTLARNVHSIGVAWEALEVSSLATIVETFCNTQIQL
jgi:hypothetical protein